MTRCEKCNNREMEKRGSHKRTNFKEELQKSPIVVSWVWSWRMKRCFPGELGYKQSRRGGLCKGGGYENTFHVKAGVGNSVWPKQWIWEGQRGEVVEGKGPIVKGICLSGEFGFILWTTGSIRDFPIGESQRGGPGVCSFFREITQRKRGWN